MDFDSDPSIDHAVFDHNYAFESGGCIAADGKSAVMMEDVIFSNNYAMWEGGCLYSGSGAGKGIHQGFEILYLTSPVSHIFVNNSLLNGNPGQKDVYLW